MARVRWFQRALVRLPVVMAVVLSTACKVKDVLYCETDQDCADNPGRPYCDVAGVWPQSEGIGKTCIGSPFDAGVIDSVDAMACRQKIAFVTSRTGDSEIFLMNEDGTEPVNISNSASTDRSPRWSPDGNWIVFSSNRSGSNQYYVMDSAGANPVVISNCTRSVSGVTWSSDSQFLVFECKNAGGATTDLYKVGRTGAQVVNLSSNDIGANSDPSISPDLQTIVFGSLRDNNDYDVFKMDVSGGNVVRLTTDPMIDRRPQWSPDGQTILFTAREAMSTPFDYPNLFTMKADGSNQINIYVPDSSGGIWSPDGTKILSATRLVSGGLGVFVIDSNGSNPVNISGAPGGASAGWSPDSSKVVFESPVGQATHIFVSAIDGSGYTDLTPTSEGSAPSWQPVCH